MTSAVLLDWTTSAYFIALLLLLVYAVLRRAAIGGAGMLLVRLGFACHTLAIGLRWYESYRLPGDVGHAPFANLYESMIFFAWAMVLFLVALDVRLRRRVLGLFMLPLTLGGMAWAQLFLDDAIEPLMPALQSHWLTYHVISCFLAYGAFATACCVSFMYLLKTAPGAERPGRLARFLALLPDAATLDEVNYRVIAIGFPVWTVGIVTGSVWASYAWGSYWSWDPKETWSLIVWFLYAAFLHARLTRGWSGRRTAWLAIGGFAATLFCYLGVNLLLAGLHSYGA